MKIKRPSLKIKFIGGKQGEDAPLFITDGNQRIDLPADQTKPFAHEKALQILKVAPELYKAVQQKGKRRIYRSAATGEFVKSDFASANASTTVAETV